MINDDPQGKIQSSTKGNPMGCIDSVNQKEMNYKEKERQMKEGIKICSMLAKSVHSIGQHLQDNSRAQWMSEDNL